MIKLLHSEFIKKYKFVLAFGILILLLSLITIDLPGELDIKSNLVEFGVIASLPFMPNLFSALLVPLFTSFNLSTMAYIFPEPVEHLVGMIFLYLVFKKIKEYKTTGKIIFSWVLTITVYYFIILIPILLLLHMIKGGFSISEYMGFYSATSYQIIYEWLLTTFFSLLYYLMLKNYYAIKKMAHTDLLTDLQNGLKFEKDLSFYAGDNLPSHSLALIGIRLKGFERLAQTNGFEFANSEFSNTIKQVADCHQKWYTHKDFNYILPVPNGAYRLNESVIIFIVKLSNEQINSKEELISNYHDFMRECLAKLSYNNVLGITFFPDDSNSLNQLTSILINLIYSNNDDDSIKVFDPKEFLSFLREDKIRSVFGTALKQNEFYFVYQPKIDIKNNSVFGYEALARWRQPELGDIFPREFIPIAEKYNFIEPLTSILISDVFQFCKDFKKSRGTETRVSLNLSVCLLKLSFLEFFYQQILTHNLGNNIEIEITESMIFEISPAVIKKLMDFREIGVNIAIDDFGTAYSNLHCLQNLNANVLKIDKSFIDGILTSNKKDLMLVELISNIGKSLNMEIVAEGVEDILQIEFLTKIGCDAIQGFYYSKPLNYNDAIKYQIK